MNPFLAGFLFTLGAAAALLAVALLPIAALAAAAGWRAAADSYAAAWRMLSRRLTPGPRR